MAQKLLQIFRFLKPWLTALAIIVFLRYTGLLSGLSAATQSVVLKTGLLDATPTTDVAAQKFNYGFTIRDLEGKEVNMESFRGKVLFLNLWATWCGPCRAEMPSIQELYNQVDKDKIAFVMLSLDTEENENKVVKYITDQEFSFPVYMPQSAMPNQLRVSTIPTTFVVGKDGKIKMKKSGMANYSTDEFKVFLEELAADPQ